MSENGGKPMRKIPTLVERVFDKHRIVDILPHVTPGMEWILKGEGIPTMKWDGACCAIINGEFYKRYDAKNGKPVPVGAIKCQEEADPVTGHFPCWVKCDRNDPSDRWFWKAYDHEAEQGRLTFGDGTYEAVGLHFRGNPYDMDKDMLIPHGNMQLVGFPRTFEGIKKYLRDNWIEGVVFWKNGQPQCKIKRRDFGFQWPPGK